MFFNENNLKLMLKFLIELKISVKFGRNPINTTADRLQ
jgi:hypothetical protein